jgi:quercetin dioxygenase-like cupin family protein
MHRSLLALVILTAIAGVRPAAAQTQAAGEADPGVRPTRLIDRAEIRVSRVEIQAGATRRVHTHDDVEYHLWIPLEGNLQITIGADAPVTAKAGQAFFMKRGTPHGFKNVGTTPGAAMEIFVKQTTAAGGGGLLGVLAELGIKN